MAKKMSFLEFCVKSEQMALLESWDDVKNDPVRPQDVTTGAHYRAWWKCQRGHSWQVEIYARTDGHGCPYCAGKMAWPGENDLLTLRPELVAQWHPTKNVKATPDRVTIGSRTKVWWLCEQGHEWQAQVNSRVGGAGCPYCANRAVIPGGNDLATIYPELAEQWNVQRNGTLLPTEIVPGTRRKVWWQCERGHEWQAGVSSRVRGAGCPVCTNRVIIPDDNDLRSQFPGIAAQWHPTKNGKLTPEMCSPASNRKVWWRCPLGHDYQATVGARTVNGSGCPYCAGRKVLVGFNDLATVEPAVAKSWHPTLNGALTPEDVTAGSRRKVWWKCSEGHSWKAVVYSRARAQKTSCPVCAGKTKISRAVQEALANYQ